MITHSVAELLSPMLILEHFSYNETFLLNRKIIEQLKYNLGIKMSTASDGSRNLYDFSKHKLGWFLPFCNRGYMRDYLSIVISTKIDFQTIRQKI